MTPETFRRPTADPVHIVDLKALMGTPATTFQASRHWEKTAMDLIQRYQSVEAIYADVEAWRPSPRSRKADRGEEQARMSYDLATIRRDAPIDFPRGRPAAEPDGPALYELFLALEFNKLIDKMGLSGGPAAGRATSPPPGRPAGARHRPGSHGGAGGAVAEEPWVAVLACLSGCGGGGLGRRSQGCPVRGGPAGGTMSCCGPCSPEIQKVSQCQGSDAPAGRGAEHRRVLL